MQTREIKREELIEAAKGAKTVTEVARRLGLLKGKLSGHMAGMIRTAAPGLDDLLKANRASTESTAAKSGKLSSKVAEPEGMLTANKTGASTESQRQFRQVSKVTEPSPDNPYRPGSTYAAIFTEGSKRYWTKAELIAKVADITGKSASCIGFSLSVLCHKDHSSNGGRSTFLRDEDGKIKLIAIRRRN